MRPPCGETSPASADSACRSVTNSASCSLNLASRGQQFETLRRSYCKTVQGLWVRSQSRFVDTGPQSVAVMTPCPAQIERQRLQDRRFHRAIAA